MASENVQAVRKHYHEFFNLGLETAYDEIAHPEYCQNGKPSDGQSLKKWVAGLRKEIDINVAIITEIEEGDRVGIVWITNSVLKSTGERLPPVTGMNLYEFRDGKIINNWHCRN